jgi:hypothetical protein
MVGFFRLFGSFFFSITRDDNVQQSILLTVIRFYNPRVKLAAPIGMEITSRFTRVVDLEHDMRSEKVQLPSRARKKERERERERERDLDRQIVGPPLHDKWCLIKNRLEIR